VLAAQRETFLAVEALGALVILDETLGFEDIVQDRRAPARLERGPMPEPLAQRGVIASERLMLERGAVPAGEAAEAALGEPKAGATERSEIAKGAAFARRAAPKGAGKSRAWRIGEPWASELFCEELLENHGVEGLISDKLLELAVLFLQQPQPFGIADLQAAELLLPLVKGGLADAVASANLSGGRAGLGFLEDSDDLFFGMSGSFHGVGLWKTLSSNPAQSQGEAQGAYL